MGVIETCGDRQIWIEECEPCDDCTSRGLDSIKKELHRLGQTIEDDEDTKQKIKTLEQDIGRLSEEIYNFKFTMQPRLESGVNIKTINNQSLLGDGNIEIGGGGGGGITDVIVNGMSVVTGTIATITDMATRTYVQNLIDSLNFATEEWVEAQGYLKEDALDNYYTKDEVYNKDESYNKDEVDSLIDGVSVELIPIENPEIDALPE